MLLLGFVGILLAEGRLAGSRPVGNHLAVGRTVADHTAAAGHTAGLPADIRLVGSLLAHCDGHRRPEGSPAAGIRCCVRSESFCLGVYLKLEE